MPIHVVWDKIDQGVADNLILSMPRPLKAVAKYSSCYMNNKSVFISLFDFKAKKRQKLAELFRLEVNVFFCTTNVCSFLGMAVSLNAQFCALSSCFYILPSMEPGEPLGVKVSPANIFCIT